MSCIKDITLKDSGTVLHFKFLSWDTCFFGLPSFMLDSDLSRLSCSVVLKKKITSVFKRAFITAKIDTAVNIRIFDFLNLAGFKYVTSEIILKYAVSAAFKKPGHGSSALSSGRMIVEELIENKNLPYRELGSVFTCSRFHSDTMISNNKADSLWISYLKTFRPGVSKRMFIARLDNKPCGVILCEGIPSRKRVVFSFVAVLKENKNQGVGSILMQEAIHRCAGSEIVTETQVKNTPAMNFYIKNGFQIIENSKTILHRWG